MLFVLARAILLRVPDLDDASLAVWYADTNNQRLLVLAVNLTTIGSIAFLWFVAVIRRRVGLRENRFFGTVFVGVALLMAALWVIGVLMFTAPGLDAYTFATPQSTESVSGWQAVGAAALTIVVPRFEAVFILSATTVGRLSDAFPRVLVIIGYGSGLLLLLTPLPSHWLVWIFPAWATTVSLGLLLHRASERPGLDTGSAQNQTRFDCATVGRVDSDSATPTPSRCHRCGHDRCLGDGCSPGSDCLGDDGSLGDRVADYASSSSTCCSEWHLRLLLRWCRYQPRSRQ